MSRYQKIVYPSPNTIYSIGEMKKELKGDEKFREE